MLFAVVFIAIGLMALVKGADWLVDGASALAARLGVAPIVIGLTVVAFGTSAPELMVNLVSATSGKPDLAIGNIIGSNLANILLILGAAAIITPLKIKQNTVWKEIPFALLAVVLVLAASADRLLTGRTDNMLDRIDGLMLLGFFVVFMYYTFGISRVSGEDETEVHRMTVKRALLLVGIGLGGLTLGGKLTVDGAVAIAQVAGVSERLIGLTIVAIGTSLPELVTSIVAARKGQADIAVGNVVGSNIFNVFLVLGISSVIAPLPFSAGNTSDVAVAIAAAAALFVAMFVGRRHLLERWQGWVFMASYAGYVAYLVLS